MGQEYSYLNSYRLAKIIHSLIYVFPAIVLAILVNSSDPIWFKTIGFIILGFMGVLIYMTNRSMLDQKHFFYRVLVDSKSIVFENKSNKLKINSKEIDKIKLGKSVFVFYLKNNFKVYVPAYSRSALRDDPLLKTIKNTDPSIEISLYWPLSSIKPY